MLLGAKAYTKLKDDAIDVVMMKIIVPLAVSLMLAGCENSVLLPIGPVAEAERVILLDSVAIMLAIVMPTLLAIGGFVWWFRASNKRARYLPDWCYSGKLELLVWSIPALVVLFLGGIAWIGSHDLDPARPLKSTIKPLEVQVVALDWKWLFIYPEQNIASINYLAAPVGTPLHFSITSATVMNVFFLPRLGSQIYAMNGMVTQLNLEANKEGTYHGLSAHFSGDGFSDMAFELQAMPEENFAAWACAQQSQGRKLDEAEYHALLQQSKNVTPYSYGSVEARLFDDIVMQKLPQGDGPHAGRPEPSVSPRQEK